MPISTEAASPESSWPGVTLLPQTEHGHATLTVTELTGLMLPLSSTTRDSTVAVGLPCTTQLYDQDVVPVAGCQVAPPSVDTSTPPTTPPPASAPLPEMVTRQPSPRLGPAACARH